MIGHEIVQYPGIQGHVTRFIGWERTFGLRRPMSEASACNRTRGVCSEFACIRSYVAGALVSIHARSALLRNFVNKNIIAKMPP